MTGQSAIKLAVIALVCVAGLWLVDDSLSFGLQPADPATGRARGCYTVTETALGRKEPSDTIRFSQGAAGLALAVGVPLMSIFRRRRQRVP